MNGVHVEDDGNGNVRYGDYYEGEIEALFLYILRKKFIIHLRKKIHIIYHLQ